MIPNVLSFMIFIPVAGAVLVLLIPSSKPNTIRWASALITLIPLILAALIYIDFDRSSAQMQYVEHTPWIKSFNIYYYLGIDGLSVSMVLLTALLSFLAVFSAWEIDKGVKAFYSLFLLLEAGMIGVFCALDFILFYVFWEVTLLPMYFLIGVWGGPRREYAAIKFFLYTLFGSVFMLLAILALYFTSEPHTFDMVALGKNQAMLGVGILAQLAFWGFFLGFAIKVPLFPFHTWLPDAHVEAPTAISVILAGILLKMGVYGIIRVNLPMLPNAAEYFSPFLAGIGVVNIIYGSLCAMAQSDMKKLVAYSSIGHMGFCLLGIASFTDFGLNGAVFQMLSHGLLSGMLFLLVGVIYHRAHHRDVNGFGGLGTQMPIYTGIVTLAFFGSLGLPGLSGFVGEALALIGAFNMYRTLTIISVFGIIIGAAYFLWTLQRMFLGQLNPKYADLPEINGRELFTLVPLGILVVILGVYPAAALDMFDASLQSIVSIFQ